MSGGRATTAARKGKALRRQAGDVSSVSSEGCALTDHWFIECKHYKSLDLVAFVFKRQGKLASFWRRAIKEAKKYDKEPMLIAKQNFLPDFVLTKPSTLVAKPIVRVGDWCEITLLADMLKEPFK